MATRKRVPVRAKVVEVTPEVVTPAPTPMVPVSSLQVGDQFEESGERYRKLPFGVDVVRALHLTNPEMGWIGVTGIGFHPDTLVIKV